MSTKAAEDLRGEGIIDSREIIEAAQALRDEIEDDPRELDDDEQALLDFDSDEGPNIQDWPYGATMVRQDCFEGYAQQLAEDIGAIEDNAQWPYTCIDWERAARDLAMDYSPVRFLGHDYYAR